MRRNEENTASEAIKWLSTSKGQESLKQSIQESIRLSKKFNESCQIDPKRLKETFTI